MTFEQMKTPHFWLTLLATSIGISLAAGIIPAMYSKYATSVMMLLSLYGYQSAAKWQPQAQDVSK